MEILLAGCQGLGLAGAAGIRPFLPTLVAGLLAHLELGLSFSGTNFEFLQSWPFLAVVLAAAVVSWGLQNKASLSDQFERPSSLLGGTVTLISVLLGALLFGASLADIGYPAWPGFVAGGLLALLARLAAASFIGGARQRLGDASIAKMFGLYTEAAALVLAILAVSAPPISILALICFVWILVSGRRRASKKYEGLRILK